MPAAAGTLAIVAAFAGLFLGGAATGGALAEVFAPGSWVAAVAGFSAPGIPAPSYSCPSARWPEPLRVWWSGSPRLPIQRGWWRWSTGWWVPATARSRGVSLAGEC